MDTIDLPAASAGGGPAPATLDDAGSLDRGGLVGGGTGAASAILRRALRRRAQHGPGAVSDLERLNAGGPLLKVHDCARAREPSSARSCPARPASRMAAASRVFVSPNARMSSRSGPTCRLAICARCRLAIRFIATRSRVRPNAPELWRAVDWTPFEISAVPVGADPAAGFRSADPLMPCVVDRDDASHKERTSMEESRRDPAPATFARRLRP